jgi:hypothetical protein
MNQEKTSLTLSERIAATAISKGLQKDINRATFLALRDEIKHAMDEGWPVKRIWENLYKQGDIKFSYQSFIGYVNRLILHKNEQKKTQVKSSAKAIEKPQQVTQKEKSDTNIIKSFVYDPLRFTKEDLL